MGSFSNYLENAVLNHVFGGSAYTPPATVYFALFTATPSDTGGGTEVAGGAYARKAVTNNGTNWDTATAGAKTLAVAQSFVTADGGNWGTITSFGIFDASTGGNLLIWGSLTTAEVINDGGTITVPVGQPVITLD